MVAELGYFTIPVADLKKAEAFYGAVFGWTVDHQASHPRYSHIGNTRLPFGFKLRSGDEAAADMSNFYIRVEDIAAILAGITAAVVRSERCHWMPVK